MLSHSRPDTGRLHPETSDARLAAGRQVELDGGLEKNLEREIDRASTLDQAHGPMEVDLVRGGENGRRLEVVADAGERLGAPLLDDLDLDVGSFLELCR
jgi:hypothetical protein